MASHRFAHGAGAYPVSDLVFEKSARTATPTDVTFGTTGAAGVIVVIDVDAVTATPSVVFTIRGVVQDQNGQEAEFDILASAAITATGQTVLAVHPAITDEANKRKAFPLPDRVRIHAEHLDADSITYSVAGILTN